MPLVIYDTSHFLNPTLENTAVNFAGMLNVVQLSIFIILFSHPHSVSHSHSHSAHSYQNTTNALLQDMDLYLSFVLSKLLRHETDPFNHQPAFHLNHFFCTTEHLYELSSGWCLERRDIPVGHPFYG